MGIENHNRANKEYLMTSQEIKQMIQGLERKEADKEKLTVCELTILDLNNGAKKKNRQLTDRAIQFVKFWME